MDTRKNSNLGEYQNETKKNMDKCNCQYASSGIELHEFFNEKGEKVIYPWESIENPDLNYNGPQDQVYVGQIIQTEDGPEKVIAVDEQGSYVTEVLEQ